MEGEMRLSKGIPIFVALIIGCSCNDDEPDVIEPPEDLALCPAACERVQELECPEGQPLVYPIECASHDQCEDGTCIDGFCTETCIEVCEELLKTGTYLGLECWAEIEECSDIEDKCR
jgi:hypothetical protein